MTKNAVNDRVAFFLIREAGCIVRQSVGFDHSPGANGPDRGDRRVRAMDGPEAFPHRTPTAKQTLSKVAFF